MLWFVEGQISVTPYMGESKIITHRGLIQADDYDQAVEKYRAHWKAKTDEYSIYYHVWDYEITETIT